MQILSWAHKNGTLSEDESHPLGECNPTCTVGYYEGWIAGASWQGLPDPFNSDLLSYDGFSLPESKLKLIFLGRIINEVVTDLLSSGRKAKNLPT